MLFAPESSVSRRHQWLRACAASLAACSLYVILLGVVFVPGEVSRQKTAASRHIVFCSPLADGNSIVSYVVDFDQANAGVSSQRRLYRSRLDGRLRTSSVLLPEVSPNLIAMDATNGRVFVQDVPGTLYVADLAAPQISFTPIGRSPQPGQPDALVSAPDGTSLALLRGGHLCIWNTAPQQRGPFKLRWNRVEPDISSVAIHPAGTAVICHRVTSEESKVEEADILTGQASPTFLRVDRCLTKMTISPNGRYLAGVDPAGEVRLFQRRDSHPIWEPLFIAGLGTGVTQIASFGPCGDLLITSDRDSHQLIAWDLERRERRRDYERQASRIFDCGFLNNGQFLSWGLGDTLKVWNLSSRSVISQIKPE